MQSEFQRKLADVSSGYQDYVLTPSGRRQFLDVLIREYISKYPNENGLGPLSSEQN